MAAVFAAAARAPLTAIVIAFELTGDYELVLPLMLAAGLATFVADRVQPESVYTWPLAKRGIVYGDPEDVDIMQTVRVGEIMTVEPDTLPAEMAVQRARAEFRRSGHHGFPVVAHDKLIGICTVRDMARTPAGPDDDATRTVGDVCTREVLTVTPEDPVFVALRRMAAMDVGRLPVVAADDHQQLVGLIRRSDLVTAYQRAVTTSLASQQRAELRRLRDLAGTNLIEARVTEHSAAAGHAVREIDWPRHTLLTSIQRAGELIMPNGATRLQAGDVISAIVEDEYIARVRALLTAAADVDEE
jgi:CIC family chloride channel protein